MERFTSRIKHQDGEYQEREHKVYKKAEADAQGIEYRKDYWNCEPGDWGLTKDGYVVECVRRRDTKRKRSRTGVQRTTSYLRFSIGRVLSDFNSETDSRSTTRLTWEDRKAVKDFTNEVPRPWDERDLNRRYADVALKRYVDLYLEKNGELTEDDFHECGFIYRPGEKIPKATFKRLLKGPAVQERIREIMIDTLKEKGITESSVLDMFLETYDLARTGGEKGPQTAVMARVAEKLMDLVEKRSQASVSVEEEFDNHLLDSTLRDELLLEQQNGSYAEVEE